MDMPIPKTYYEWSFLLKALKSRMSDEEISDEKIIDAMNKGEFIWQGGSGERLIKRIVDCINFRVKDAQDKFDKESQHFTEETHIVKAIIALRNEFKFLLKISEIPNFPKTVQENIKSFIQETADQLQTSMEKSTKDNKIGKIHSLIKNNKINSLTEEIVGDEENNE